MSARVIYKYELAIGERTRITMPGHDVRLLSVGCQAGKVLLWAEVMPSEWRKPNGATETFDFMAIPTGFLGVPEGMEYLGTARTADCEFVWHCYWTKT